MRPSCGRYSVESAVCKLCERFECIKRKREESVEGLQEQAKRMLRRSDANFPHPSIGDTVRIPVPDVDRGKTDARSILACVMEVTKDNLYRLGTSNGVLNCLYARSQFVLCHEKFVQMEGVPTTSISLRTAASSQALSGGQGFVTTKCSTGKKTRCMCRKKGVLCNSRCHSSNSCENK